MLSMYRYNLHGNSSSVSQSPSKLSGTVRIFSRLLSIISKLPALDYIDIEIKKSVINDIFS